MDPEYGSPQPVAPREKRLPIARKGLGTKGMRIPLLSNHFKVNMGEVDGHLYHYSVNLMYEDGFPVNAKGVAGVGRKVIDMLKETYAIELGGKDFAYDGEKSLYTVGSLPNNKLDFMVMLRDVVSSRYIGNAYPDSEYPNDSDTKWLKRHCQSKQFKVEMSFAAKIPMQAIADAVNGHENENTKEALRVLDIVLRQHAARQACLLVNQSYFFHDSRNFTNVGGGALRCMGFHSSFRNTQAGLSLNIDVTSTMIVHPGPLVEFLFANQNVTDPFSIDWDKAKRMLKNLIITTTTSNQEFKITGLSELPCKEQTFTLKQRNRFVLGGDPEEVEITVYDYFVNVRKIKLRYSGDFPCINVGKPKRPTFIPLELCTLVSLQRYTKALTNLQRASFVEISSTQKPQERKKALSHALKTNNYDAEPMLRSCGISISKDFVQIEGRVLQSPKLKSGTGDFFPRDGSWNLYNKRLVEPTKIERWSVVNFSVHCNPRDIVTDLIRVGGMKGVKMDPPKEFIEEKPQFKSGPPAFRVEKMFEELKSKHYDRPKFLLCLLPERNNCDIYGPWKKKCMSDNGIVTQCMAPTTRVYALYLTNLLLKINAKLGGLNSMLAIECTPDMPIVSNLPTLILGMDVSHGSPGRSDVPSIAAVVSSRAWPSISRYRATVRTQPPKVEMIENLFKPVSDTGDEGIIRELLLDFYTSSGHKKPEQIIIFRDGVSESQFNQVLNIELDQIIEACKFLDKEWDPKFVVIVAQKNHHTRFFQQLFPDNIPPGTIIDNEVCHPRNYDFYLCAHSAKIGTARPTHYHVLHDEIGISPDDLQELVHNLSYVYQRSTSATSVVSPVRYAHLAAAYMAHWIKSEEASETSSRHGSMTDAGSVPLLQLPKLHDTVSNSMFFC